jgi:PAS domain S-box-containing protein
LPVSESGGKSDGRWKLRFLRRPVPLRVALVILMLGALLPSLMFFALEYRAVITEKQADVRRQGRAIAQAIGDDITREIAIKQALLASLASSPDLRANNLAAFYVQAQQAGGAFAGWITLLSADGRRLFNTHEPFQAGSKEARNPELARKVAATERCDTTNLFKSPLSERHTVAVLCPVRGQDYVIASSLPVEHLCDVVRRQTPQAWVSTLVDRNGLVVARSDCADASVGSSIPEAARARMNGVPSGWLNLKLDGADAFAGWQNLPNGWALLAAVPRATLEAPMRHWRTDVLWSLFLFSGLAFVSAALVGEWIIRSMKGLAQAAVEIGAGRVSEPRQSSIREVNEVGKALAQAARDRAKGEFANAHLAAVVTSSGDAIMSVSLAGEILSWNAAAESLYGYTASEAIGRQQADLVPSSRLKEIDEKFAAARAGRSLRLETVRRRKDGQLVEVSLDAGPVRNSEGELVGISVIAHDISERKRNEEHMEFVMRELSHRTKNLITVIIAMARRTARQAGDFSDFEAKFTGRLHGLARSHDLLVHTDWVGGSIEELVRSQLSPFVTDPSSLLTCGPDLLLRPEAVQNLGFALHELATNANKFGALSQPAGRVTIHWEVAPGAEGEQRIRLNWTESGGPEVTAPSRSGFGSTVIQKLTEASLNATVTVAFEREGFRWTVDMPANEILSEGDIAVSGLLAGAASIRQAS